MLHWYNSTFIHVLLSFPETLWEPEAAQGVPKSERESWLVESVETLLSRVETLSRCGDLIKVWRLIKLEDVDIWCLAGIRTERWQDPNKARKPH